MRCRPQDGAQLSDVAQLDTLVTVVDAGACLRVLGSLQKAPIEHAACTGERPMAAP